MQIDEFIEELKKINIDITNKQLNQLEKYYKILVEENEKINLTSITKKEDVYLKHYYDSLTLNKIIDLNNIDSMCDIGTGAGFPGIVIKIMFPNIKITLVDSLNKRIEFLKIVVKELNLSNVELIHARAEEYDKKESFDVVTSRALADVNIGLELCMPLVKVNGYYLPMVVSYDLGKNTINELGGKLEEEIKFYLPIENSERKILKVRKVSKTKDKYPRSFSQIKKNPLK